MEISALSGGRNLPVRPAAAGPKDTGQTNFGDVLQKISGDAAGAQKQADTLALQVAAGEPVDLHEAIIAMQQADLSLRMAVQVRNKLVEAYQEVMRMQV